MCERVYLRTHPITPPYKQQVRETVRTVPRRLPEQVAQHLGVPFVHSTVRGGQETVQHTTGSLGVIDVLPAG